MEAVNSILSGIVMPVLLVMTGIIFAVRLRFFYILHPVRLCRTLAEASRGSGTSPFRALTVALAGTLGVGNMAGVATAVTAGGAGALFWMWISALCAMSVKYAEVRLALETRHDTGDGHVGGAMYYIEYIFRRLGLRAAPLLGGLFAVLCVINSLLTGNIVQVNAAASVFPSVPPYVIGIILGAAGMWIAAGGGRRISSVTLALIPFLSIIYMVISIAILIGNAARLPAVMSEIVTSAFSLRAAGAGAGGFCITRAIRYGVTRGIFSNEAGCGTSPTAHARADVKSPHHQACFGIFEVFADTIVLCSMTGFVLLLDSGAGDGIPLTLHAFSSLAGEWAGVVIGFSVILFAFATVICQAGYGLTALEYLSAGKAPKRLYLASVLTAAIIGSVMSADAMWQAADFIISLMTAVNVSCLLIYTAFSNKETGLGLVRDKGAPSYTKAAVK